MHVISKRSLVLFWAKHPDTEDALKAWYKEAEHAEWKSPAEIKARYRSADILPGNRVVLNIKGNRYRLILKIHYNTGVVYIRFVGTHAEYDKIDAGSI